MPTMKLLKIIDATLYETEPRKISDHLELVLKDIRKRCKTRSNHPIVTACLSLAPWFKTRV